MAKTKADIESKKYLAKILYTREQLEGKVVAQRVGVAEKTISKWVTDGNWKALRNRLLVSKDQQLNLLYEQLEKLNEQIQASEEGFASTREADIIIKLTAAIRNLENDLNIADLVESGIRFVKFTQSTESFETTQHMMELWNSFLQAQMKR